MTKARAVFKGDELQSYSSCTDKMVKPNILTPAIRQYCHNKGVGLVMAYDRVKTESIVTDLQNQLAESERLRYETIQAWSDKVDKAQDMLAEKDGVISELKSMYERLDNAISEGAYYEWNNDIINYIGNLK